MKVQQRQTPVLSAHPASSQAPGTPNSQHARPCRQTVNLSKQSLQTIQRSYSILQKQLSTNRQYLFTFDTKLQEVYKRQLLRNSLKKREYQNMLKQIEENKSKLEEKAQFLKNQHDRNYQSIVQCNQQLMQLKQGYQAILGKCHQQAARDREAVAHLTNTNRDLKAKIKVYWGWICAKQKIVSEVDGGVNIPLKAPKHILRKSGKNNKNSQTIADQSSIIQQQQTVYLTSHNVTTRPIPPRQPRPIPSLTNHAPPSHSSSQTPLNRQHPTPNTSSSSYLNRSVQQLQQSLLNICHLQQSIKSSKKQRTNFLKLTSTYEQSSKKQKIKEKIEEVEFSNEMMKLLIVFLKKNQEQEVANNPPNSPRNKCEITNWYKIRCYFEKLLEHKQAVLTTATDIWKTLLL